MEKHCDLAQIVIGCKNGDWQQFSRLVDLYGDRCYGFFYRLTGDRTASDDLLSELFVKVVEKIGSFKGERFDSWLFKVAGNLFNDYLRDKQRKEKLLEGKKKQLQETRPGNDSNGEQFDRLQEQLGKLDADSREVIMLRFYSGASFNEIAEMRSEPIGTTLSKVHRGLKKLRELMGQ
jgi:RNA polymerase sigma-70 factor, ECF subfamily